jgi:4-amino-4-deoxy-L-arabinose transferase-like glycosyltransferase
LASLSPTELAALREQVRTVPFLRYLITNIETSLASSDLEVMRDYAALVEEPELRDRIWQRIESEWHRTQSSLALLLGTGTLVLIFALARQLYSAKAAFMAVVLVLLTPASAGLNLFLTIDTPLLLTWSAALALFWAAVEKPHCWVRWLLLTLVIGLGTLSKQMMLVFPLLMVVFAFVSKADRVLLKNPRFWLSMIVGAAFLLPVLWWNEQHAWITLEHTKHHFDTKSVGFGKWLTRTLEWPGVQALV